MWQRWCNLLKFCEKVFLWRSHSSIVANSFSLKVSYNSRGIIIIFVLKIGMDLNDIEFLSIDVLIANVSKLSSDNSNFNKNLGQQISSFLNSSILDAKEHERTSKDWLSWCKQQQSRIKASSLCISRGITVSCCPLRTAERSLSSGTRIIFLLGLIFFNARLHQVANTTIK